jgi:diaminopimelate epimerase
MKNIEFIKMHGLGNDFIMIDLQTLGQGTDLPELAKKLGHRQLGIGCDQLIFYSIETGYVTMKIFNCDGSEAKACGNASRCLTRLIYEKTGKKNIELRVGDRKVLCHYDGPGDIWVNMGIVSFAESWMPDKDFLLEADFVNMIAPEDFICVDVANPHAVIFSSLSSDEQLMIGQKLQNKNIFPDGVNVNFVTINQGNILLRTWERGSGFTYACGSGAVASFAAAYKLGLCQENTQVIFELGALNMGFYKNGEISMQGPAQYSFYGSIYI